MCFGYLFFDMAFKRRPIAGKFKPDSYFSRKLMGDRFPELVDLIKEHRERLQAIPHEELEMETADGLKLKGWYFDAESKNTAVIVHGFNSKAWTDCVVQACRFFEHGYNVLISDNRACGESEGKYLTYGVRESEDIARWVSLVSKRVPNGNIVLIGTSLGGATVCMCSALDLPDVKVIVEDCAYVSMRWEFEYLTKFFVHFVPRRGINAAERLAIKKFGFDFSSRSPIESIQKAKCPVFFVHGKADTFIPYSAAEELYAKCPTDKQLLLVETCGHGGAQLAGDDYFEPILAFVDKYCK